MRTFVINLKKDISRLETITQNLKSINLPFERFDACDGHAVPVQSLPLVTTTLLCNPGMVGCFMSHRAIWQKLVDDPFSSTYCVLEDDARVSSKLHVALSELPDDMDICYLHQHPLTLKFESSSHFYKAPFGLTTTAYVIHKKFAAKLLKMFTDIYYHVDFCIALASLGANVYILKNPEIVQARFDQPSTISPTDASSKYVDFICKIFPLDKDYVNWQMNQVICCFFMKHNISSKVLADFILERLVF